MHFHNLSRAHLSRAFEGRILWVPIDSRRQSVDAQRDLKLDRYNVPIHLYVGWSCCDYVNLSINWEWFLKLSTAKYPSVIPSSCHHLVLSKIVLKPKYVQLMSHTPHGFCLTWKPLLEEHMETHHVDTYGFFVLEFHHIILVLQLVEFQTLKIKL